MCVSTGYIPGWRFLTVDKILHSVELTLAPWCQVLLPTHCVLGEIPRLSHIWVVSKKWFFLGVFLAWIDGIVSFLFCCFNANEYWPPFLSSFYWFPVKLQDIMLNKCHKGHWVIIERVVSTVPLGVQGLCPTPISAVFKWPKGPLLADSTLCFQTFLGGGKTERIGKYPIRWPGSISSFQVCPPLFQSFHHFSHIYGSCHFYSKIFSSNNMPADNNQKFQVKN